MKNKITLAHGAGAEVSRGFIKKTLLKYFKSKSLAELSDSAKIKINSKDILFTTDSYVVNPVFFPGGNIGDLAVCGTVNDISVSGGDIKYISLGLIIEEGLDLKELEQILKAVALRAKEAGVEIVTGDTKVVERGGADKIFINTSGIGQAIADATVKARNIKKGDKIIVSGNLAEHGISVMNERHKLGLKGLKSDVAPLNKITKALFLKFDKDIHMTRDLTRGGLAGALKEIAEQAKKDIELEESRVPLSKAVKGAVSILGVDPLQTANEGKFVCIADAKKAESVLKLLKTFAYGKDAKICGTVLKTRKGRVYIKTPLGASRALAEHEGSNLPRIC
ncbi:(NiFe) hydrogenase maturation protein [Elusimicrobium minutum Pei191]|uniref:(NiFe) hydrogenase maturation protein n=1 Tax=Elusimicrobium minutum (strain Pei191) TaxID=445932 RepID=B2KBC5_ELUMP|nr:hydrogenase expression/formation protein HypE [Elusimicrobium minutum]ACC97947.1 (NiFe) hydrogenase maturation protein [Elusimicrobium minutum Pei191]